MATDTAGCCHLADEFVYFLRTCPVVADLCLPWTCKTKTFILHDHSPISIHTPYPELHTLSLAIISTSALAELSRPFVTARASIYIRTLGHFSLQQSGWHSALPNARHMGRTFAITVLQDSFWVRLLWSQLPHSKLHICYSNSGFFLAHFSSHTGIFWFPVLLLIAFFFKSIVLILSNNQLMSTDSISI